jgi:hypothetical protein
MYATPAKEVLSASETIEFMRTPGKQFFPDWAHEMVPRMVNYFNNLHNAVVDSQIPILDKGAAGLLDWRTDERKTPTNARRAAAPTAGRLFTRIPTFNAASLDEIIDIRADLGPYISGFQKEILSLSITMLDIAESDFDFEVERLLIEKIQPQLDELDQRIQENRYLRRLADAVASDWKSTAALAGLVVGASVGSATGGYGSLLAALLGSGAVAGPTVKALRDRFLAAEAIRQHRFYFLHQVTERLGSKRQPTAAR